MGTRRSVSSIIDVPIPAGVEAGSTLCLQGKGLPSHSGAGTAGNLYLVFGGCPISPVQRKTYAWSSAFHPRLLGVIFTLVGLVLGDFVLSPIPRSRATQGGDIDVAHIDRSLSILHDPRAPLCAVPRPDGLAAGGSPKAHSLRFDRVSSARRCRGRPLCTDTAQTGGIGLLRALVTADRRLLARRARRRHDPDVRITSRGGPQARAPTAGRSAIEG